MNITFYSNVTTREDALRHLPLLKEHNVNFLKLSEKDRLINDYADTNILIVDAMGKVDKEIIQRLPDLKLIHCEGVGYQGIDISYAGENNIAVCNNKGVNDTAVAENAIMLMLACLRQIITGNQSVYDGRQIDVKAASFGKIRELSQCTVGLIGFGDIGKATAKYCRALGAKVIYTNRTRYSDVEKEYGVEYVSFDTLLSESDFVSLHIAVTPETVKMANYEFFKKMKNSAFLINTARGDLVDNQALVDALLECEIAGAGLDVIYPEPVTRDNILLDNRIKDKLVLTPHIAGITSLTVEKIYKNIRENICALIENRQLKYKVN